MKIKSILLPIAVISIVALVSYYIGGSMRGGNSDTHPVPTSIAEIEHSDPSQELIDEATNQRNTTTSNEATLDAKQKEAIDAEYERKRQETENYYVDQFRRLQQKVETTLMKYDAADRAAFARFTEQLNHTISKSSGNASMSGYVSPYGSVSAHGYYDGTTETKVVGNPSEDYEQRLQRMNRAVNNLMDEYELDFEHLQRQRTCALNDLEKEKALSIASVRSQGTNQSTPTTSSINQGTVTGIIYSEENPLAVIDGKVLHEMQNIRDVKVIKINQNSVEFEKSGVRWSQKVNEPASANWP